MGYKMKGFSGFKSSPAKVSDEDIVKGEKKLAHQELDFREPGWAKAARGIHEGAKGVLSSFGGGGEGDQPEAPQQNQNVADIAKENELAPEIPPVVE